MSEYEPRPARGSATPGATEGADDERTTVLPAWQDLRPGGPEARAAAAAGHPSPYGFDRGGTGYARDSWERPPGQGGGNQGGGQGGGGQGSGGQGSGNQGGGQGGGQGQSRPAYGPQNPYGQPAQPGQGGYGGYGGYGSSGYGSGYGGGGYGGGGYGQGWAGGPGGPGGPGAPGGGPGASRPGGSVGRRRRGGGVLVTAAVLAVVLGSGAGYAGGRVAGRDNTAAGSDAVVTGVAASPAPEPTLTQVDGDGELAVEDVARNALPSVVSLTVVSGQTGDSGSGVILSSTGMILTNNHVIAAAATSGSITVSFNDGTSAKGRIVGRDPVTDLAVVQAVGKTGLRPATLGNSSTIAVGQQVVAVGSPLGLNGTVTTGIISALNRPVASSGESTADQSTVINALQTDAPINPGNSGGPLYNLSGQVIGVNSAIAALPSSDTTSQSGSIGLGFAIPINQITPIVAELETSGKATHAQLGISVETKGDASTGLTTGATVQSVRAGSAAQKAGLRAGDVITEVEGRQIIDADSLVATIRAQRPGDKVSVTFSRDGRSQTVEATLDSDG